MKKILICLGLAAAFAAAPSASFAETVSQKAGTTSGEFLRLSAGAKPAGMGEAYAGLADDAYSMFFNVAGLSKVTRQQALFAHTMYYMDVNHEYAAYARPFIKGGLGASFTYLMTTFEKRAGDTEAADSNGSIGDMAVSLGYAQPLLFGVSGGLALKYISSKLDTYNASSIAADIGFQRALNEKVNLGLAVSNLAGSLTYITETVPIGSMMDIGLGTKELFFKNLTLTLDYKMLVNASYTSINLGAQYQLPCGDDWGLAPRAGFISGNSTITAGFGLYFKDYQFDYAFNSQNDLGVNNRFSLGVQF
jgi:hypothetical protein